MFEKLKTQIDLIQKTVDQDKHINLDISPEDALKKFAPNLPNLNTKLEQLKSKLGKKKPKTKNKKNLKKVEYMLWNIEDILELHNSIKCE